MRRKGRGRKGKELGSALPLDLEGSDAPVHSDKI